MLNKKEFLEKLQKDRETLLNIKKRLRKIDEQIDHIIEDPESLLEKLED